MKLKKNKVLNQYSVESNGETVEVSVIETEKGILVSINGTTMDVHVNNEEIYSKFDKPEYKSIPSHLRGFVEKHLCSWTDGIIVEKGKVQFSLDIEGLEYYVRIPTNRAKSKDMLISNWLMDYNKIQDAGAEVPSAKENYDKLVGDIKAIGYDFRFCWDGNEYDVQNELVVPINEFDEDKIKECFSLWENYNANLDKFIDSL